MAEIKPFVAAQLFTGLVGREVKFTQVTAAPKGKGKQVYGEYILKPAETTSVVQLDLALLGSLGGAMLGLSQSAVAERLAGPDDETLRDAMHEVLNVASTIVSNELRAVFKKVHVDTVYLSEAALDTLQRPIARSYFSVTVDGYDGGQMSIFSV